MKKKNKKEKTFLNITTVRTLLTTIFNAYNDTYRIDIGTSSQPKPHMRWMSGFGVGPSASSVRNELEKYL